MIYRYPKQGIVSGVCVGLAKVTGLENWIVRLLVIGLFFFGGFIIVPLAYLAATFLMEKAPDGADAFDNFDNSTFGTQTQDEARITRLETEIQHLQQRISQLEQDVRAANSRGQNTRN